MYEDELRNGVPSVDIKEPTEPIPSRIYLRTVPTRYRRNTSESLALQMAGPGSKGEIDESTLSGAEKKAQNEARKR